MKVALVYDRVNKWGGAERVLLALHELFPQAPLYTAVYHPQKAAWAKVFPRVIPTFLQKIPLMQDKHELLATLTPVAFETLDLSNFDLVVSVTSEAAKGVVTKPETVHICYCLTPTRYLWSGYDIYFANPLLRFVSKPIVSYLRYWDRIAAQRPDIMIAISSAVRGRIKKYYKRNSQIVYPPVDLEKFKIEKGERLKRKDFFLVVSRFTPYKKLDLAVEAFNRLNRPLLIVGTGGQEWGLRRLAQKNVKFLGELTDRQLSSYYKRARALIFPQEEDFGIAAVEAQALGCPVIAYKAGGAIETVIPGKTGEFFYPQTAEALAKVVKKFKPEDYKRGSLVENAERFSKERFFEKWRKILKNI